MTARALAFRGTVLVAGLAVLVAVLMVVPAGSIFSTPVMLRAGSAGAATGGTTLGTTYAAGSYNWPELHNNAQLTGLTRNTSLSTSNAPQLGVRWAAELYGQAVDSPSVVYNANLGESLVYIGTETGYLEALDLTNGHIVWANWLGSPVVSSPVYDNGSVFAATQRNSALFNINATTGDIECTTPIPFVVEGTPVVATPPGGVRTVYIGSENTNVNGPMYAINAGTCKIEWTYAGYTILAGTWDPNSYVVAANGTPLLIAGTSDPDSAVYAIDALTGKLEWRYQTIFPAGGNWDIGAGVTISAPGVNGFVDGVAYAINKWGGLVALNLSSGKPIWGYNIDNLTGSTPDSRSTFALDGINLVFGHNGGMFDVNAKTGALIWQYDDPSGTEIISSPAIAGRTLDSAIVVAGDLAGSVDVLSLQTGHQLYSYQTGNYITGSPAISDKNILIDSTDSLLYDLAVGGSNDATLPTTSISSPAFDSSVANPAPHNLTIYGNATDPRGVAEVGIGIETGGPGGPWWDGATGSWNRGPYTNPTTLASPNATSTAWTYSISVPAGGQAYTVEANAISIGGQTDFKGATSSFGVSASRTAAHAEAVPSTVGPGETTVVNGSAFGRNEVVTISYLNQTLATERTTSTGYVRDIRVTIPTDAGFGLGGLTVTGERTGKTATAPIEVLNNWVSNGYNSTGTDAEPYDPTFYNLIEVGTGTFVHVAWNFVSGAPINATPIEASNVVYVANLAGDVYAVSAHNGGLYWTWSASGGSALLNEAIDTSLNLLYVTAQNETVYAISTVTGTTVWSEKFGGILSAPQITSKGLYVAITTASGALVDMLSPSTGAVVWSEPFPVAILAAPAVSDTGSLLVVGSLAGVLYAVNATTGAAEWNYSAGGEILAAATIWDGVVYFGSTNGKVYALTTAGKLDWSYKIGSPVEDTGAITATSGHPVPGSGKSSLLMIGANNGVTYGINLETGKLKFTSSSSGAVVSVTAVQGMVVDLHANGTVSGVRNYADFGLFNMTLGGYLTSTPVVVNGAIYITSGTGVLYAYTGNGQDPV
jgi:eukaryotic-like serine/threonine-protein kinase